MGRRIDEVIASLPEARRDRIESRAVRLAREMIDHADSLGEIRKAMSKTQGAKIVLRSLGDLGGKDNAAAKLRRASSAKTAKRRAPLAGLK